MGPPAHSGPGLAARVGEASARPSACSAASAATTHAASATAAVDSRPGCLLRSLVGARPARVVVVAVEWPRPVNSKQSQESRGRGADGVLAWGRAVSGL